MTSRVERYVQQLDAAIGLVPEPLRLSTVHGGPWVHAKVREDGMAEIAARQGSIVLGPPDLLALAEWIVRNYGPSGTI